MDERRAEALSTWSHELAHLLRNQQMILTNALYSLDHQEEAPLSPDLQAHCLRLAQSGVQRAISLLEAYVGLGFPGDEEQLYKGSELLSWFSTLVEPRLRRISATLRVETPSVELPEVVLGDSCWTLAVVTEAAAANLGAGCELVVVPSSASPPDLGIDLRFSIEGAHQGEWESLRAALREGLGEVVDLSEESVAQVYLRSRLPGESR